MKPIFRGRDVTILRCSGKSQYRGWSHAECNDETLPAQETILTRLAAHLPCMPSSEIDRFTHGHDGIGCLLFDEFFDPVQREKTANTTLAHLAVASKVGRIIRQEGTRTRRTIAKRVNSEDPILKNTFDFEARPTISDDEARPDFTIYSCPNEGQRASIEIVHMRRLLDHLSDESIEILKQEIFDIDFGHRRFLTSIFSEDLSSMTFYDSSVWTRGLTPDAELALGELNLAIKEEKLSVGLEAGSIIILDNRRTLHCWSAAGAGEDETELFQSWAMLGAG